MTNKKKKENDREILINIKRKINKNITRMVKRNEQQKKKTEDK